MAQFQSQPDPSASQKRPRRLGILLAGVGLGILLATLFLHVAFSERTAWWNHLTGFLTGRTTTIDTSSVSVVEEVRRLSRLETVVYSIDKVVEGQRENVLLPSFLAGDKLLLIAHGEVIAGIDMAQLKSGDVSAAAIPFASISQRRRSWPRASTTNTRAFTPAPQACS
jgi:hypothetical protein